MWRLNNYTEPFINAKRTCTVFNRGSPPVLLLYFFICKMLAQKAAADAKTELTKKKELAKKHPELAEEIVILAHMHKTSVRAFPRDTRSTSDGTIRSGASGVASPCVAAKREPPPPPTAEPCSRRAQGLGAPATTTRIRSPAMRARRTGVGAGGVQRLGHCSNAD